MHLLEPHHDGSPTYVQDGAPTIGSKVALRVHVPRGHPLTGPEVDAVWLRSVRDGEPHIVPASIDRGDVTGTWWRAQLVVSNPVTSYRFLLGATDGSYRWLNGTGAHARDVTDAADFRISTEHRLPDWVLDQVGYQVFPDRFARDADQSSAPPWAIATGWDEPVLAHGPDVPRQWYGGTLEGIRQHMDHLTGLGVTLLYLTPFFAARSNHRYDAESFDEVDPVLGGDAALARLLDAAHQMGIRVIGDLTTNHTGEGHPWFQKAKDDHTSIERSFYRFHDDESYESWLGVESLPKIDHAAPELRRRLYEGPESTVAKWLRNGIDGWRIDVANMTGRLGADDATLQVAQTIRDTIAATRPDAWLLAEHGHDASLDLPGNGWHGTMDYAGFTRPIWSWLNGGSAAGPGLPHDLSFLGLPVPVPTRPATDCVASMRDFHAAMPWSSRVASTSHLDSHDSPRFRTVAGGGTTGRADLAGKGRERHALGLALQMTLPGIPVVFMGDELGFTGVNGEHSRTPMPWGSPGDSDSATLEAYRVWIRLRREHLALRRGGLRWAHVGADSLTFLREHPDQRILVHVVRADHPPVDLPLAQLLAGSAAELTVLHGSRPKPTGDRQLRLPHTIGAHVYELPHAPSRPRWWA
jgi:alpha-glucosidase